MSLTCFKNGSLARERVRDAFGLTWDDFSRALSDTPAGNGGRILLPWYEPEITPFVPTRASGVTVSQRTIRQATSEPSSKAR